MKILPTAASGACKHERFSCDGCGALVWKEKPGPKGFNKKMFLALARRVAKTFEGDKEL